jgi:adenylylsulfate kinase-like enzyme
MELDFFRQHVDQLFHRVYDTHRSQLQNRIIHQVVGSQRKASENHVQWLIFMAGSMGCGKTSLVHWMQDRVILDQNPAPVLVDLDLIRAMLPEHNGLQKTDLENAGTLTQKESGYISELCVLYALHKGLNVIVDGSMRNLQWYKEYILRIKAMHQDLKLFIVHVIAPIEVIKRRVLQREHGTYSVFSNNEGNGGSQSVVSEVSSKKSAPLMPKRRLPLNVFSDSLKVY